MVKILVTGGSGYVGSHCVLELLSNNHQVVVIDNLSNSINLDGESLPESLKRVEKITGKKLTGFYNGNIQNEEFLSDVFKKHPEIDIVMHFAALKAVSESISKPLLYYGNNVSGSISLLSTMEKYSVKKFIFSSSATVYGIPKYLPLDEKHPIGQTCSNPYGKSKAIVEQILEDVCRADPQWSVISLRYFNPVGAHQSGMIGEDPNDIPNNLMPYISQVAAKIRPYLTVYGNDYDTPDSSGVRDYIHIDDLADGHLVSLNQMLQNPKQWSGYHPINLGTGSGTSVLQMVKAFEKASGVPIPYEISSRRPGDLATVYGDVKLAKEKLGWQAKKDINDMCKSAWNWQSKNPNGYRTNKMN